ncbi:MAG: hypothetical protein HXX17_03215 [Geobacteraceae bacterium]|nr:hypothetical protein [Geobacteraceae bacterium]
MRAGLSYIFLISGLLILSGFFTQAYAIPAFSREHNTECATCHTIYPELNEYGDAFLKNGFVWNKQKKGEPLANAPQVKGEGDPDILRQLKEVAAAGLPQKVDEPTAASSKKSEPLWLAGLPQTLPISLAATLNASYNDDAKYDKVDLSTRAISLLAGGVIRDKLGFFLKYNLYSEGIFDPAQSNTPLNLGSPYANDLEEFYLVWRNALGSPLNLKAGRFRPTLSLWKKNNKTGISDFATTSFRVGKSTFSADAPADAVEANAILFNRLYLATGLVDRKGQDANEGYGHVSLKIGGSDFKANEPDIDLDKESIFDYMYLVLGCYGYTGRNSFDLYSQQRNNFYRAGADADLIVKSARIKLAFARENDKNPDYSSHQSNTTDVLLAQAEYMFTPDLLAFARYEYLTVNDGTRTHRYIPAVAYAPIQNVKLTIEYQHVSDKISAITTTSNIALLGVRVAF